MDSGSGSGDGEIGVSFNSTTATPANSMIGSNNNSGVVISAANSVNTLAPTLGYNYAQAMELTTGGGGTTATFLGTNGGTNLSALVLDLEY